MFHYDPSLEEELRLRPRRAGDVGLGFLGHRDFSDEAAAHRREVEARRPPDYLLRNARMASMRRPTHTHQQGPLLGPGLPPPDHPPPPPPVFVRRAPPTAALPERLHSCFGRTPPYLHKLHAERKRAAAEAEAARRAAAVVAATPSGCRLVSPEERDAALALIMRALEDAQAESGRFPLALDNKWRVRQREALDARLASLEEAMRLFCRPTVYLPLSTPVVTVEDELLLPAEDAEES